VQGWCAVKEGFAERVGPSPRPSPNGEGEKTARRRRAYRSAEALPEQIAHLDEEGAAVAAQAGGVRAGDRVLKVVLHVVVVAGVKSRPRTGGPAEQKLAAQS